MRSAKKIPASKPAILFFTAFIGVGAVFGSCAMFLDPTGGLLQMQTMLPYFQKMPFAALLFQNYIFPGIALLIVNGLSNLAAFVLILRERRAGYIMGWVFGITLMLWICIQFWLFAPEVFALDTIYFILGLLQFAFGFLAYVRYTQRNFSVDESLCPDPESRTLVVFFSRTGYTKKLAYDEVRRLRCPVLELRTTERIAGDLGFLWCGRFGMHGWSMALREYPRDFSRCDRVLLFSPVWVFGLCGPVRRFLEENSAALPETELTAVHFMASPVGFVFSPAKKLLGERLTATHSVRCRFGKYKVVG